MKRAAQSRMTMNEVELPEPNSARNSPIAAMISRTSSIRYPLDVCAAVSRLALSAGDDALFMGPSRAGRSVRGQPLRRPYNIGMPRLVLAMASAIILRFLHLGLRGNRQQAWPDCCAGC